MTTMGGTTRAAISRKPVAIRMRHDVRWMVENRTRMQQGVEIENVVVERGRRPHGLLHFTDEVAVPRVGRRAALDGRRDQAAFPSS